MKRTFVVVAIALLTLIALPSCDGNTPSAPSNPPPPQAPVTYSINATVQTIGGRGIADAVLLILEGHGAGQTFTASSNGTITLTDAQGTIKIQATSPGCATRTRTVTAPSTSGQTKSVIFPLPTPGQTRWSRSGAGNTVFDMPRCIDRVHIDGTWNGTGTSDFIVYIDGDQVVNEDLSSRGVYSATHLTTGGIVEIVDSADISWMFTEVQ